MTVVGVDVAKYHLDLHLLSEGTIARYDNAGKTNRFELDIFIASTNCTRQPD